MSRKGFSRLPQDVSEDESDGEREIIFTTGRQSNYKRSCCCLLLCAFLLVVLVAVGGGIGVLIKYTVLAKHSKGPTTTIPTPTPTPTPSPSPSPLVLKVNTTLLERSGAWLNLSWEGVVQPSGSDWIGVYSPPVDGGIDAKSHAPISFQYASHSPSHLKEGRGSLLLRLVNMRDDVIIGFFRKGLNTSKETAKFHDPVPVAVTDKVQFRNWNEPLQGHLALTRDPTEMILVWVTRNSTSPKVKWGTESGNFTSIKEANSSTYTAKDMCGSPATDFGYRDMGLLHQVTMDNLIPGTQYYYIFGNATSGWSEEFSFRAAPLPGPNTTTRAVVYGDMGCGHQDGTMQVIRQQPASLNTTRLVLNQLNVTDLVLHIGDISYARGFASVWDVFFDQIQPIATRVPYMVCIGNHERDWPNTGSFYGVNDSNGECGVPHERRFPMPRPSLDEPWYGFDYGSVHFVLMSTEHNFTVGSPQYQFLERELQTVDRSVTPWLIFAGHRPMYIYASPVTKPSGELHVAQLMRDSLEPLFKNYSVDLAMWGHDHSYQRTCPVFQEKCTEGATVHVVAGMGGQRSGNDYPSDRPEWLTKFDHEHRGYTSFVANATSLVLEYVKDDDGMIYDTVTLTKP